MFPYTDKIGFIYDFDMYNRNAITPTGVYRIYYYNCSQV